MFWLGVFSWGENAWNIIFIIFHWHGGHSGGATPGLVSIPEVKSSSDLGCTVDFLWEPHDVAGLFNHIIFE